MRSIVFEALKRTPSAPFYFQIETGRSTDYEKLAIDLLSGALMERSPAAERMVIAKSLATFHDTDLGEKALETALAEVKMEISRAHSAKEREELREITKALKTHD